MSKVSEFTNENFRILSYMYDNKNEQNLVKITQQEVSEELSLSRVTINKIFKQLKENGYIVQDTTKVGRYYLTAEGIEVVETFRKINKPQNSERRNNDNEWFRYENK